MGAPPIQNHAETAKRRDLEGFPRKGAQRSALPTAGVYAQPAPQVASETGGEADEAAQQAR
eukprot:568835-Pyramimonas_sp.AAC.1